MKILVNNLPKTCEECQFCAEAMMMTPLGVQKQVNLCTVWTTLVPPTPNQPPKTIEKSGTPEENDCLFTEDSAAGKIIL